MSDKDVEVKKLLKLLADERTENMKLRAALKSCIAMLEQLGYTPISKVARAALEGSDG